MASSYNQISSQGWSHAETPLLGNCLKTSSRIHKTPIVALVLVLIILSLTIVYVEPIEGTSQNRRQLKELNVPKNLTLALMKSHVIPDVIDSFIPSVEMKVVYKERTVKNGVELTAHDLTPFFVSSGPTIAIGGSKSSLYTLVFVDPDAPSPGNAVASQYLHMLYVNVPGQSSIPDSGDEIAKYTPPNPPFGVHRYVIALFLQQEAIVATAPQSFSNFDVREFSEQYKLNLPVAALYFVARKADGPISEWGSEPKDATGS